MIKQFLYNLLEALILIISIPFLILLFFFWIIPWVIIDTIREKVQAQEEKQLYNEKCNSCPHREWCSSEEATCDMYGEVKYD